jgi:hypothetical protein
VVAGDDEKRGPEGAEKDRGAVVLLGPVPVREVAACDDELRRGLRDERPQIVLDFGLLLRSCVEIRHLQEAYGRHRMGRL